MMRNSTFSRVVAAVLIETIEPIRFKVSVARFEFQPLELGDAGKRVANGSSGNFKALVT